MAEAGNAGRMTERDVLLMRGLNVRRAAGLPVKGPAVPLPGGLQARLLHPAARLLQGGGLSYLVALFCRGPGAGCGVVRHGYAGAAQQRREASAWLQRQGRPPVLVVSAMPMAPEYGTR